MCIYPYIKVLLVCSYDGIDFSEDSSNGMRICINIYFNLFTAKTTQLPHENLHFIVKGNRRFHLSLLIQHTAGSQYPKSPFISYMKCCISKAQTPLFILYVCHNEVLVSDLKYFMKYYVGVFDSYIQDMSRGT